jgi:hypothetical protein
MDIVGDDLYPQENDWYLPKQINRICTRDFSRYGMFAHIRLPYTLPIPEDILECSSKFTRRKNLEKSIKTFHY